MNRIGQHVHTHSEYRMGDDELPGGYEPSDQGLPYLKATHCDMLLICDILE